jgi:hypothetical protein
MQQAMMKRCREPFVGDTPRKRRRLVGLDSNDSSPKRDAGAAQKQKQKQGHGLDDANNHNNDNGDCIVVSLSAPESPDWRVIDIPPATDPALSDAATSPHTPRGSTFEWRDTRDVSLVSPLDSIFSPVTEYSEWRPLSPPPGSETTAATTAAAASLSSSAKAAATTRRNMVQHFSDVVAPSLLFGSSTNRFRELLLSLAGNEDDESVLMSAMCAVAGAHLRRAACAGADEAAGLKATATDFHSHALAGLAELIEKGGEPEVALATIMLLVAYEIVWTFS